MTDTVQPLCIYLSISSTISFIFFSNSVHCLFSKAIRIRWEIVRLRVFLRFFLFVKLLRTCIFYYVSRLGLLFNQRFQHGDGEGEDLWLRWINYTAVSSLRRGAGGGNRQGGQHPDLSGVTPGTPGTFQPEEEEEEEEEQEEWNGALLGYTVSLFLLAFIGWKRVLPGFYWVSFQILLDYLDFIFFS